MVRGREASLDDRGLRGKKRPRPERVAASCLDERRVHLMVIGMPINGQRIKTANPTTTISMILAGMP